MANSREIPAPLLEELKEVFGPFIDTGLDARVQLRKYYNHQIDLTPEQYRLLHQLDSIDPEPPQTNPKEQDRAFGRLVRKKRTGSRRG